jgi:enterochelin esterase-like enzyme
MPRWTSFDAFLTEAHTTADSATRQALVNELLEDRSEWPWIDGQHASFIYIGTPEPGSVALNLDTIRADPPFAAFERLSGTTLWHLTRPFQEDDILDYLLAIDDPMTPLAQEKDIAARVSKYWKPDSTNSLQMSALGQSVSVLRMGLARPYLDWTRLAEVPRGNLREHPYDSAQLGFKGRKLWVYTPPGYEGGTQAYPLLIFMDGQWATGPLQLPSIADTLIKHKRVRPMIIAMVQSGDPDQRAREYACNDRQYLSLLLEVLPLVQSQYRVDATSLGLGGVALGAAAAAHATLQNPAVFNGLTLISPPLGKSGEGGAQVSQLPDRLAKARALPDRIFQSVGRYEQKARFLKPARALAVSLQSRHEQGDTTYKFAEVGSGHGLVGFRSVLPEALAWAFPGENPIG